MVLLPERLLASGCANVLLCDAAALAAHTHVSLLVTSNVCLPGLSGCVRAGGRSACV